MNEITLEGKTYISSKQAAEITGYAKDYVGQLCREGRIEARLVGRNWYVLESAIREHRFGKDEKPAESAPGEGVSWSQAVYKAEEPVSIPPLTARASVNALESLAGSQRKDPILADMQSAWQEWFSKREQTQEIEPERGEKEAGIAEEIEINPEESSESFLEANEVQVAIHPILQQEEPEVSRYEAPKAFDLVRTASIEEPPELDEGKKIEAPEANLGPSRRFPRISPLVLRSVFVAIALLTVAITIIGTGFGDEFSKFSVYRLSEIQFIAGVSAINK